MWKMIGSILVLTATSGAGFLYGMEQQDYLEKLLYIRHIIYMLKGELEYTKAPLGEVFGRAAVRVREPYKGWLHGLERQGGRRKEDEFFKIWMRSIDRDLHTLHLKSEHVIQLKELGSCLGRMDSTSESLHLKLYVERLELEIEKVRESLSAKKRIGNCLGVMGGIFLIVILI